MDHEAAIIERDPFGFAPAFAVQRAGALIAQLVLNKFRRKARGSASIDPAPAITRYSVMSLSLRISRTRTSSAFLSSAARGELWPASPGKCAAPFVYHGHFLSGT